MASVLDEFDPVSATFNELVARGSHDLKFWRGLIIQVMSEAQREGDERWRGLPVVIERYERAIQTAIGIETGKTPPAVVIQVRTAQMGAITRKEGKHG